MFNFTKEIKKFCSRTARRLSPDLPPTVPIIINYNIDIFDEIPQLAHTLKSEGYEVRELASPVLIYYKLQDKEIKDLLVPGVFIQRSHYTIVDGVAKDTEDYVETNVKMVLTRAQMVKVMSEEPLSDHREIQSILNELEFDERLSGILEDYLTTGLPKLQHITEFSPQICFYPELDVLTYIYTSTLDLLSYSKIGEILDKEKGKQKPTPKLNIPKLNASTISRVISAGTVPAVPIPLVPSIPADATGPKVESEDVNLKMLKKVLDNYFYQTRQVFSVISSTHRQKPLKLHEVLYSCKEKTSFDNLAFNEMSDPITRNATTENEARSVGNPNRYLPIFPLPIMEHILLGNFPFMLIYTKSVDKDNLINDPLYHIKRHMLSRAVECLEGLKIQQSSSFTIDEWSVIKESNSIVNKMMIDCLYLNGIKPDKAGMPTGVTYRETYEMCFVDFSLMNAYLKNNGVTYNNDITQYLNYISPIDINN